MHAYKLQVFKGDHNRFVTVLGDHLQSERTLGRTLVCNDHPPKMMTCCLPPVKLTRDKTVYSAQRTQKARSIDKESHWESRTNKISHEPWQLWYDEETLRKKH